MLVDICMIPYLLDASREFAFKNSYCYLYLSVGAITKFRCGTAMWSWGYSMPETSKQTKDNIMKFVLQLPAEHGKQILNVCKEYLDA